MHENFKCIVSNRYSHQVCDMIKRAIIHKPCLQWATPRSLVPDLARGLGDVLAALSSAPIVSADVGYKGTQLKVSLVLKGGQRAVFKPKWLVEGIVWFVTEKYRVNDYKV